MAEQEHLELMERYLAELAGKSVMEQLKLRRVATIVMRKVSFCTPHLRTGKPIFEIWIKQDDSPEKQKMSLGHEICHTFDFDVESDFHPLEERTRRLLGEGFYLEKDNDVRSKVEEEEEDFCEKFAKKWLTQGNNREEAEVLIKKTLAAERGVLYIK